MPHFDQLKQYPPDAIFGLAATYKKDPNPDKINLGIGVYKSEESKILLLNCVHEAEKLIVDQKLNKGYFPIEGDTSYAQEVIKLVFDQEFHPYLHGAQTIGCTGALRISGELLKLMGKKQIYIPNYTWGNHTLVYKRAGLNVESYPYYNMEELKVEIDKVCEALEKAPNDSAVLFQVSCQNPAGRDLSLEEWERVADIILKKDLFLILDSAYHGFGDGLIEDMQPVQFLMKKLNQFFLCYSFSKNFGVYGERAGAIVTYDKSKNYLEKLSSNIKICARGAYSNPPLHGSRIIKTVLGSKELNTMWQEELSSMRKRIKDLRKHFVIALDKAKTGRDFSYINIDRGLFSLMGFTLEQIHTLREKYGIYIIDNSRLNIAALTLKRLDYVVNAIKSVTS